MTTLAQFEINAAKLKHLRDTAKEATRLSSETIDAVKTATEHVLYMNSDFLSLVEKIKENAAVVTACEISVSEEHEHGIRCFDKELDLCYKIKANGEALRLAVKHKIDLLNAIDTLRQTLVRDSLEIQKLHSTQNALFERANQTAKAASAYEKSLYYCHIYYIARQPKGIFKIEENSDELCSTHYIDRDKYGFFKNEAGETYEKIIEIDCETITPKIERTHNEQTR